MFRHDGQDAPEGTLHYQGWLIYLATLRLQVAFNKLGKDFKRWARATLK